MFQQRPQDYKTKYPVNGSHVPNPIRIPLR